MKMTINKLSWLMKRMEWKEGNFTKGLFSGWLSFAVIFVVAFVLFKISQKSLPKNLHLKHVGRNFCTAPCRAPIENCWVGALEFSVYCPIQRNQFGKSFQINHRHGLQDEVEQWNLLNIHRFWLKLMIIIIAQFVHWLSSSSDCCLLRVHVYS